jgi:hypothetical protein
MVRLRSVGVFSCAKIFAVVQGAIGVLIGFIFLVIGVIGAAIVPGQQKLGMVGIIIIAVLMPVFYAVLGFVMGAIWAFVYNLAADSIGGLELELETVTAPAFPAPPQPAGA